MTEGRQTVDVASYRGWEGQAKASHGVVWAIAGTMIRQINKRRLVRLISRVFTFGACIIASVVFYFFSVGEADPQLKQMLDETGYGGALLAVVNRSFQQRVAFWAVLLTAIVASPLIAADRRSRALSLYFSRPIGHVHYVVGKLLALFFFLGMLLLLPPLCMYLVDISMSGKDGWWIREMPMMLRSLVPSLLLITVLSAIGLGASSLTERPNYAGLLILGLMLAVFVLSNILAHEVFRNANWLSLSPLSSVRRIGIEVMQLPEKVPIFDGRWIRRMDLGWAWLSFGIWTVLGVGALVARVRKVEVVA